MHFDWLDFVIQVATLIIVSLKRGQGRKDDQ